MFNHSKSMLTQEQIRKIPAKIGEDYEPIPQHVSYHRKIASIIYQLRNSIAHNKATELHFSYSNTAEYTKIIDLIKRMITNLEPAIVDLISINPTPGDDHPLEYDKRKFEFY